MSDVRSLLTIEGYEVPTDRSYHPDDDTWLRVEGDLVRIGMDVLGQETAGDLAQLALREPGTTLAAGDEMGSLEAQKYVGALRAPVGGAIVEVNQLVLANPRLVNTDPFGEGWLMLIRPGEAFDAERSRFVEGDAIELWFREKLNRYRAQGAVAE